MLSAIMAACGFAAPLSGISAYTPSCPCHSFLPELTSSVVMDAHQAFAQDSVPIDSHRQEKHLKNIRQLTFGGQNAEAYWSYDGSKITYQTRQPQWPDEQIVTMNLDGSNKQLVSTGKGRSTCSYFTADGRWIYFSSTHEKMPGAQPPLDMSKGYLWMVNPAFSLYRARPDGSGIQKLIDKGSYIAETTIDPNGKYMTFTGDWEGDLEIYRANLDGTGIRRLTNEYGYDGGPFVSWDGKKIVYRRAFIENESQRKEYADLLKQHLVRPSKLEIMIMDADGKNKRQVTSLAVASFAPFLHPDGKRIIFSSNFGDKKGREFEMWIVNVDGTGLERVTYTSDFDGFPMFSRDGKKIVWASNRNGKVPGETNIFVADWVD
ncbi:MAG: PD40 domain-containing protein [Fimbriimonadaceae bacterium]|nr:PD40 domain-containing protein [Fimbriimonadaceae bacterium]